jgi:Fe2+ or Zn2+ uptake regulation protein
MLNANANARRAMVLICERCNKVHKFNRWIPYEEVQYELQVNITKWQQEDCLCPDCKKKEQ